MSLNLISDPWIPVVTRDGSRRVIAPWQIADADLLRTDWPRPDLDIACLELLIGLIWMADPPADPEDWEDRRHPDRDRLHARLVAFAAAFELLGEGPRFMQELGGLEAEMRPPGTLFIDSGGDGGTLMVREDRYGALDLPMAAMALFAMQTQAPSGGRGNLTSLRGGGPMINLVDPGKGLWPLIWANVPEGRPATPDILPWMRRMPLSADGRQYFPHQARHPAEVMFGMPRRLWLVADGEQVSGVMQRPSGIKYVGWRHPLTPYYRVRAGDEPLPVRPRAGHFGYRNWLGIAAAMPDGGLRERAQTITDWQEARRGRAQVIVAGWAMENMKARDFILSRAPIIDLDADRALLLAGMVEASELLAVALRGALAPVLAEGEAREAAREAFFMRTQDAFEARLDELLALPAEGASVFTAQSALAHGWLDDLRRVGLALFEECALPGLADRPTEEQQRIIAAHSGLAAAFAGRTKQGRDAWGKLLLHPPSKRGKEVA